MPGGTKSVSLQQWFLQFRTASGGLRLNVLDFTEWLSNRSPSCDANCYLVGGRLIALDNQLEVRPVGVGDTLRQIMSKCVLRVAGQEAKVACGTEQLAGGVEEGMKGGINGMHLLWVQNSQEEDWGLLLIYAWNEFNEENRTAMFWDV